MTWVGRDEHSLEMRLGRRSRALEAQRRGWDVPVPPLLPDGHRYAVRDDRHSEPTTSPSGGGYLGLD